MLCCLPNAAAFAGNAAKVVLLPEVTAAVETDTVDTLEDVADDPAIWVHPDRAEGSLILGTDKRFGLRVYRLDGEEIQALPIGRLNNVDLIQDVTLADWSGDLAAATNRSEDSVVLFSITEAGARELGRFSTAPEPYGFCMGLDGDAVTLFVAHKQGFVQPFVLTALEELPLIRPPLFFDSQIEGCVFDPFGARLFVGEEEKGIWSVPYQDGVFDGAAKRLIDRTGPGRALTADVEGLTLYQNDKGQGLLIASSQGSDMFVMYSLTVPDLPIVTAFRIVADPFTGIDGAQETDGLAATPVPLGARFPDGALVVQDGFNVGEDLSRDGRTETDKPLAPQNFKIVDFRAIDRALRGEQQDRP
ncbi:MAG: phytase [Alphaproteobacteria bacterium]